jgi:hypothetical protein
LVELLFLQHHLRASAGIKQRNDGNKLTYAAGDSRCVCFYITRSARGGAPQEMGRGLAW